MKFREVILTNELLGEVKAAPLGFSWTTFFFGFIPALIRSDWKWAIIQFILSSIILGISNLIMPFIYNRMYIRDLLNNEFLPSDDNQAEILIIKGIMNKQHIYSYNRRKKRA